MRKSIRFLKERRLIVAAASAILPGVAAAAIEYILTDGNVGWIPLLAACIGGLGTWIALALIELPESVESSHPYMSGESREQSNLSELVSTLGSPNLPMLSNPSEESLEEERFFSPRTPAELVASIDGLTDVMAEKMTEVHIGHWMRVEGIIANVGQSFSRDTTFMSVRVSDEEITRVSLSFDSRIWHRRVSSFAKGDRVSAIGKIDEVSSSNVYLVECELADYTTLGA